MKLELVGVKASDGPFVEIDDYVPVTIQWPGYRSLHGAPVCLMVSAGASLVELKLNAENGEIVELILVDVKSVQAKPPVSRSSIRESGVPLIRVTDSSAAEQTGSVAHSNEGLTVRFADRDVVREIGGGGVFLEFSAEGEFVGFSVRPETPNWDQLGEILR